MNCSGFYYYLDFDKPVEEILDLIDSMGFSTPHPFDSESLRIKISQIIRENMEKQGIRTYDILTEQ